MQAWSFSLDPVLHEIIHPESLINNWWDVSMSFLNRIGCLWSTTVIGVSNGDPGFYLGLQLFLTFSFAIIISVYCMTFKVPVPQFKELPVFLPQWMRSIVLLHPIDEQHLLVPPPIHSKIIQILLAGSSFCTFVWKWETCPLWGMSIKLSSVEVTLALQKVFNWTECNPFPSVMKDTTHESWMPKVCGQASSIHCLSLWIYLQKAILYSTSLTVPYRLTSYIMHSLSWTACPLFTCMFNLRLCYSTC